MSFEESLQFGQLAESRIGRWLRSRGSSVLPIYEKEIDDSKGPRLFTSDSELVAPDMLVFPAVEFIEAKHKTVFTWHRNSRPPRWVTGIDSHHYTQYLAVQKLLDKRIWLFFLHEESKPDERDIRQGSPPECPTGLYAGSLDYLSKHENHRHDGWGPHGMVYWAESTLRLLATLEDLERAGA